MRLGMAFAAGVLAATIGGMAMMQGSDAAETFDAALWRASTDAEMTENPRFDMVDDAAAQVEPGMTRADLVALFGEPSGEAGAALSWDAGFRTVQFAELVVELDPEGRAVRAYVSRD